MALGVSPLVLLACRGSAKEGAEDLEHYHGKLSFDVCDSNMTFKGSSYEAIIQKLNSGLHSKVVFQPDGPLAANMSLSQYWYFDDETLVGEHSAEWYGAAGLGLFPECPVVFDIRMEGDGSCDDPDTHFGVAIQSVMEAAGRRAPKQLMANAPFSVYGALLLKMDKDDVTDRSKALVWDQETLSFRARYTESGTLSHLAAVGYGLIALTAVLMTSALGSVAYTEYLEALDNWVVQYDWLWKIPGIRPTKSTASNPLDEELAKEEEEDRAKEDELQQMATFTLQTGAHAGEGGQSMFESRFQLFTFIFVLDNVLGNSQSNAESYVSGIKSAVATAWVLNLLMVVPSLMAYFVRDLVPVLIAVAVTHSLVSWIFGVLYYCSAPFRIRRFALLPHQIVVASLILWALAWLCTAVLFFISRILVDMDRALCIVVPFATIIIFAVMTFRKLKAIQKDWKEKLAGKAKKGSILRYLRHIGLDTSSIVFYIVATVLELSMLWFVLLMFVQMEKDPMRQFDFGAMTSAVVVPVMAFVRNLGKIESAKKEVEKKLAMFEDKVEDVTEVALTAISKPIGLPG